MDPMKATGPSPVPSPVPSPLPSPEQSSNRALVVTTSSSASARRMALESLRITSSAASGSAGLGGYLVQRVERKSDEPDERALVTGPMGGPVGGPGDGPVTPPSGRPLRAAGARSPAMERFTSLARTSSALPLSRKAALRELEDSEGQLRRQMLCVVSDAQLQAGGDRAFAQGCRRLLALDTSGAGLVGLVAGALALELEPKAARESRQDTKAGAGRGAHYPQQADRERLVDAVLEAAQDEAARDGAAFAATAILASLCEVFHGTGHWMPAAQPFLRLVLDRLLGPEPGPRTLELLQAVTAHLLLQVPPEQLPLHLAQVLHQPFLDARDRADRIRALVGGLAEKSLAGVNDACLGRFLGHLLEGRYTEADRIVLATELQQYPALWRQACQPRVLTPLALGRLMLARTGVGVPDACADTDEADATPITASHTVSRLSARPAGEVETKSRAVVPPADGAALADRVLQVLALSLTLEEGLEGQLAREVVGVYQALHDPHDPGRTALARQTLLAMIRESAPASLELTNAALACGWGIAAGLARPDSKAPQAVFDAFVLPAGDRNPLVELAHVSLQVGLATARDLGSLATDRDVEDVLRLPLGRAYWEAIGPLGDDAFTAALAQHAKLKAHPRVAAAWLDALVGCFSGPDFQGLGQARARLFDLVGQALAQDDATLELSLAEMARCAGSLYDAAFDVVSRRYETCLWMLDANERKALAVLAGQALKFLEGEQTVALQARHDSVLPQSKSRMDRLKDQVRRLKEALQQLKQASPGPESPRSLAELQGGKPRS